MTTAQPFHPLTIPIRGTNLIEASAGTGKTWGIAALFTRLIVLEKLSVESVLVVTFTKAATAELKTRLRARLDEALGVLETLADRPSETLAEISDAAALSALYQQHRPDLDTPDPFIFELLQQALAGESLPRLRVRLKAAIGEFDSAAIFTIHGFCQRLLRDYAFLCQVPFDTELADDNGERLLTPAQDFWRTRVVHNPTLARLVFEHKHTPQTMLAPIRSFLNRPYLEFRRPDADLENVQTRLQQSWQAIAPQLPELAQTFWNIHPALNGNSYRKNTFENLFVELQAAADNGTLPPHHEKLPMLAADTLADKVKKGQSADLTAFARLQTLADLGRDLAAQAQAETQTLLALQLDMLDYINQALAEQKKSRRERGYDDLLLDVHHALTESPHRTALAETVSRNWQVALIDEFQDTDPLQYEIFRRSFIEHDNPLFLVGDPKQAIYSFRGADIYAYLQAAEDADQRYTLAVNYRSHAKLVDGIGALFTQKQHPFVLEHIDYAQVRAARETSRLNPPQTAIQVRWLHGSDTEPLNKEALRRRAADYCADEIAAALNQAQQGRLNFNDAPLQSGHIAVLVRTHNEGRLVADALKARGVQSVLIYRESVFASAEAEALAALIGFWLQPQRTEPLRFVLGGVLFDYTAADLYALNQSEAELLGWIQSAEAAADAWQQHGFYAAMQQFAARHGIETRLLSAGKERSLTNYHQILEKLAEEDEQSHTAASLHQWLLAQIQAAHNGSKAEGNILRLESDEALVKIVTIHASKGLEYPLVFCPFVWDAADGKPKDWQILHRSSHSAELLAKAQLSDEDQNQLADEETAEDLRLLYVALTRAAEQLTIYAAHCNNTERNTFAYLLEGTPDSSREAVTAAYAAEKKANKAEAEMKMLKNNWQRFIDIVSDGRITFTEAAPDAAAYQARSNESGHYQAAKIPERTFEFIRHTSFTGLSRHTKAHDNERDELQPAIDPAEALAEYRPSERLESIDSPDDDIHYFPRGANAGVCLHELLETLDFAAPAEAQNSFTQATLTRYGFDADYWLPAVNAMLDQTRQTPLTGTHTLADIPAKQRLPEMAFMLHMRDFSLPQLRLWFAQTHLHLPESCIAARLLDFSDVNGFLNGFIDMVYQDSDGQVCIIDYKSNHLGMNAAAYTAEAMNEAMAEHHYYLQALIYAIAVARYFKLRGQALPRIAVRYLFLRGLDGSGNGVWQWDIDTADLAEWL